MKKKILLNLLVVNSSLIYAQHSIQYLNSPVPIVVDKNCIDGKFCIEEKELFYKRSDMPSINDLVQQYNQSDYMQFIYDVLQRRFPTGKAIIEKAGGKNAIDFWLQNKNTARDILMGLPMAIHEVGHGIDKSNPENWYYVAKLKNGSDLTFTTPGMHGVLSNSNSPMYAMERSLLLADTENSKRPPKESTKIKTSNEFGSGPYGSDNMFAETYLIGDPTDKTFDSGDQGYNSLIEETLQYINSLATVYYFNDYKPTNSIGSDYHAVLTLLWWNERYLAKIRVKHPDQYKYLINNQAWRELILTLWGRAWKYLYTDVAGQQPDADFLKYLVKQNEMLSEIQLIRDACGCKDPVEWDPNGTTGFEENKANHNDYLSMNGNRVSLGITTSQNIIINVYNLMGQKIETIFNGFLNQGQHEFLLPSLANNSPGVYFIHVQGTRFYEVKKIRAIQ